MTIGNYRFIESNCELAVQTEKESFAEVLINQAVEPAFCLGENGQFIYVNDATCRMSEYSREELLTMTVDEIDVDFSPQVWSELWQRLKSDSLTFESRYRAKTNRILKVQVSLSYVKHEGKEFSCAFVREKKDEVVFKSQQDADKSNDFNENLQKELKTSVSLLRSTLESTASGIVAVNLKGEIVCYNQKFMDMWQIPTTINISKKYNQIKAFFQTQVKDLKLFGSCAWEMSSEDDAERYDLVELKDGRTFAHYSQPQRLGETIIGRVWSIWDVTESKQTESALRLNETRFRTLAETTEASILLIQGKQLCYVNPAAEALTGYTIKELLTNFNLDKLILSKKLRQVNKQDGAALCEYQEMQILTKNGSRRWLACTVALLDGMLDFFGKPVELITAIDITDYKQAELNLCRSLEQAKRLSEDKERFVSMLCHQFRTPLNMVSFSADLLKRHIHNWTEEKKCSYFNLIQVGIKQISHMLDDILLFSKTENLQLQYQPTEIDLNQFCCDIVSQVQLGNSNQQSINFVTPESCITAYFDAKMLQYILMNLLSNAIKYSPADNSVTLKVCCEDENIIFQVQDAGIGIPVEDQQHIFEPFYRGSNIDSVIGTGLGLSIVKTIVDLHQGEIAVESQLGVGSTFTVTLPPTKI